MGNQSPALERLFDEWTKKHEEKISQEAPYLMPHEPPFGGFVRDGIVNLDVWKKQKLRICFLMNEASGYTDREKFPNGTDVAAEWNEKGAFTKFMFKVAVWTKAVHDAFAAPTTYSKKEIIVKRETDGRSMADDLIRSIAIVNLKKSDGQKKTDLEHVKRFATNDAEEIRRELDLIKANVIICCGNFSALCGQKPAKETRRRKSVFFNEELERVSKFAFALDKRLVLTLWTPAQFVGTMSSNTIAYYAVREICRAAFKVFGKKPATPLPPAEPAK